MARSVLESNYLLKMLFSEEPDTLTLLLDFICRVTRQCGREQFSTIPEDKIYALLDEMVCTIFATSQGIGEWGPLN